MDDESQAHILLQLSNLELYIALFGVVVGGWAALMLNDQAKKDHRTIVLLRFSGVMIGITMVLLVVWLASALVLRFAFMIGAE